MVNKKKADRAVKSDSGNEYQVITVTELDLMVYDALRKQSAAKPSQTNAGQYVITDQEKAKSQNILPRVLNPLGQKGWRLCAINKMECYIFEREKNYKPMEYLVLTPPDLDRTGLQSLEKQGHLKISGFEGKTPKVEITAPEKAKIQVVLPEILASYGKEGWRLAAINGPQLYFFTRPKQ